MHEIIAIIFDFDDTLAPDSTSGYLGRCGIDVPHFWKEEVKALTETKTAAEEWDPVPAYLYKMVEKSRRRGDRTDYPGQPVPLGQGTPPVPGR